MIKNASLTTILAIALGVPIGSSLAAEQTRPNILFCIADDASYPHMGAYGCSWVETPAFDRVAREGLLFRNAYTPNAKCAPSRACILTGRNTWQLKEACNHVPRFPVEFKSYVEVLASNGYATGRTGKGWAPGVAVDANGEQRQLAGKAFSRRRAKPVASGISPVDYAGNFADFLEATPAGKPWCFWYGGFEPHRRYEYGSGVAKGGKKLTDIDDVPKFWPDNATIRNDMLDYAFEIEHFDLHLGRMLELLESRGQLENTIVVVTADNGMPFPRIKGQKYELSNHLPLAIMWKRGVHSPGRTIDDYVSFIDFAPTFIEAAGLKWTETPMAPSPGRSLSEVFRSDKSGRVNPQRDHVLLGKERHDIGRPNDWGYPVRGIIKEGMLYLHNFETDRWPCGNPETGYLNCDGSPTKTLILEMRRNGADPNLWRLCFGKRPTEELYDVRKDPECLVNLAGRTTHQQTKQTLHALLWEQLKSQQDPRVLGNGHIFDRYEYAQAAMRGFYERYTGGEKLRAGWVNPGDFEKAPIEQ